jgi:O-antigen ligase
MTSIKNQNNPALLTVARTLLIIYAIVLTMSGTASLQAALVISAFILLLFLHRKDLTKTWEEARWLLGPLLLFSIWVICISGFWREPPLRSWDQGSWNVQQPWFGLDQWRRDILQPMLAMWCGFVAFRTSDSKKILFWVQAVFVLVLAGKALQQFYIGDFTNDRRSFPDLFFHFKGTLAVRGFSRDNIFFSYVLLLLTPGIFYLILTETQRLRKQVSIGILFVLLFLIFLNKRRGTWIACGLEIFIVAAWMQRRYFVGLILASIILGLGAYHFRPQWFARDYDQMNQGRLEIMKQLKPLISQHPWSGVGFGKDSVVKNYWSVIYQQAHNTFANVLLELGFPGLILWIGVLACYAWRFWEQKEKNWMFKIGFVFLLAFCVRNCFDDLWVSSNAELFWFTIGILIPPQKP